MTAVLHPANPYTDSITVRFGSVGPYRPAPTHQTYVRRRLLAVLLLIGLVVAVAATARSVLADRGSVPASTSAIRPASAPAADAGATPPAVAAPAPIRYIIQPGDSLWSLAERFHGGHAVSSYVDALVEANGGATVQPGQLITLPS